MKLAAKLTILGLTFAVCGVAAFVQGRIEHERRAVPPNELYEVVRQQIRAVRSSDYASAYRQVSTRFQEQVNMDAFSDLARSENPAVSRAERVEFGAVRFDGRRAFVPVYLFLRDGDVIPCIYSLIEESGRWKIDGSRVLSRWPAGRRLGGLRG